MAKSASKKNSAAASKTVPAAKKATVKKPGGSKAPVLPGDPVTGLGDNAGFVLFIDMKDVDSATREKINDFMKEAYVNFSAAVAKMPRP